MVKVYKELGTRQQAEGEENRKVIAELQREVLELKERDDADERVAEEAERGTAKGRSFEELRPRGDRARSPQRPRRRRPPHGEQPEGGGKKGDTVVELGARDGAAARPDRLRGQEQEAVEERRLDRAQRRMSERDAAFAVLVVAGEDKVPAGLEELTEYQGNKYHRRVDREEPDALALELAYRYVRARVLTARDRDARGRRRRRPRRRRGGRRALKRANRVRKSLTNITNSAEGRASEFDEMVADVERCLARIEALVAAAASDARREAGD